MIATDDPFTMLAIGATVAGGAIKTVSDVRARQAAGKMDTAEAQTAAQLGGAEKVAAETTEYGGFRAAEAAGLRKTAGPLNVAYGAGNISGRTPQDVRGSRAAIAQIEERETLGKYQEVASQERLRGAEYFQTAALKTIASGQERAAIPFEVAGDVASTAGQAFGVASKWYNTSPQRPKATLFG